MKYGARNQLRGKVAAIKRGAVMAQVTVDIGGGQRMSSVMTADTVRDLKLKKGDRVLVLAKAVNVMLVKE